MSSHPPPSRDRPRRRDAGSSAWRERPDLVWVTGAAFVGMCALTGVLIEVGTGLLAWLVMVAGLVVFWVAGLVILVWLEDRRR